MLVVLDDAAGAEHVQALMPGTPESAVLVTSRDDLAGWTVFRGAAAPPEPADLCPAPAGARRPARCPPTGAEPAATTELVRLCGGFPLPLRVAAAQLIQRPQLPVADHVARLRSEGPVPTLRIDGDERADMAAAFDGSCRLLTPDHRRLPYLLVRVPVEARRRSGGDAAAALDALASMSLLDRLAAGRFRMHALVRDYVRSRRENALAVVVRGSSTGGCGPPRGPSRADAAS